MTKKISDGAHVHANGIDKLPDEDQKEISSFMAGQADNPAEENAAPFFHENRKEDEIRMIGGPKPGTPEYERLKDMIDTFFEKEGETVSQKENRRVNAEEG